MSLDRPTISLVALCALAATASPARAATGLPAISEKRDGPTVKTLIVTAAAGEKTATVTTFLRQSGRAPLPGVRFVAGPFRRAGVGGTAAVRISFKVNDRPIPPRGVVLRPAAARAIFGITISGLSPGVYSGRIFALRREAMRELVVLRLRVGPLVEVVGAGVDGLRFSHRTAQFRPTIEIRSNSRIRRQVALAAAPLLAPDGSQTPLILMHNGSPVSDPVDIPGLGSATVRLEASVPLAGDYTSALTLSYGGSREAIPIMIKHERAALSIEFQNLERAREAFSFPESFGTGDVSFLASVVEKSGHAVVGLKPSVVSLAREEGDVDIQATYAHVRFEDMAGKPIKTVNLEPDGDSQMRVVVENLTTQGEYSGTLRLRVPGGPPVVGTFSLTVKRSIGLAILLIAIGLALSAVIRWVQLIRSRATRQISVTAMTEALRRLRAQAAYPDELDRIGVVISQADELGARIGLGQVETFEEELATLRRKHALLQKWITVNRSLVAKPNSALRGRLNRAGDSLAQATTQAELLTVEQKLDKIEEDLASAPEDVSPVAVAAAAEPPTAPGTIPSLRRVRIRLILVELAGTAIIALVALVIGVELLYANDKTWGDLLDLIAAGLWGLTLHQVGGWSLERLPGLRGTLTAPGVTAQP